MTESPFAICKGLRGKIYEGRECSYLAEGIREEETGMGSVLIAKPGQGKRGQREAEKRGRWRQAKSRACSKERGGAERAKGWEVALGLTNTAMNPEHRVQRCSFTS